MLIAVVLVAPVLATVVLEELVLSAPVLVTLVMAGNTSDGW